MTATPITVEQVDPTTLLVDLNARSESQLDKTFVASIRDLGVLVPIVAVRTEDGRLRVRYGKRRTLASIEAGRPQVPVVVVGDEDADDAARIVAQWHENEYRTGLGTRDKLTAVEQLSLLGLSTAQIAKRTKARKADVEQALAASSSALAKGATERYDFLTLDQASAIAEFETDPATVKALVAAARNDDGEFRHILQRARDDRAEAQEITALTEQLTGAGVQVVGQPGYGEHTVKALADLVTDQGRPIAPEDHRACPGDAAYVGRTWRGIEATHVCTDWKAHGHRDRYNRNSRPVATPMDEKAKAERKTVIARNRAWKSAETVRREWLATFLSRKTPPKGAAAYVAAELAHGEHMLRRAMERGHECAATLLSADTSNPRQSVAVLAGKGSDTQAQVIALGLVLGAVEDSTGTHTWRNPDETVKRYFAFLAANGYTLSDVERIAAGTERPHRRRTHRTEFRLATATSDTQALS